MFSTRKHRDVAADLDTPSLDFGRQLNLPDLPEDQSITLWGPGVQIPKNPSSILSHSLDVWRKENAQLSAAKAAEELDKLYENLPQGALDLTFEDMMGRNNLPKSKEGKVAKSVTSPTKINEEVVGQFQNASNDTKDNGRKISVAAKIAVMLSPKRVFSSSKKGQLSHDELDRLVEKRQRKSTSSDREGLYSASSTPRSTPATSFRRVSPLGSPKLSPTPSFTDYMLQIDRHSFEKELIRSASFLELYQDDSAGTRPVDEEKGSLQPKLPTKSQNPSQKKFESDADDCSTCTRPNLFFAKTSCLLCGQSYCPTCKDIETREVVGGRRCKKNCLAALSAENGTMDDGHKVRTQPRRKQPTCWPFGSCKRVEIVEKRIDAKSLRR